jgi:hypothetical protein
MGIFEFLPIFVNISNLNPHPIVCFNILHKSSSDLIFILINNSKMEVEVYGKLILKVDGVIFQDKIGFYGDKNRWVLQPLMQGDGHRDLKDLKMIVE